MTLAAAAGLALPAAASLALAAAASLTLAAATRLVAKIAADGRHPVRLRDVAAHGAASHGVAARRPRRGTEEHIDGGAVTGDQGAGLDGDDITRAVPFEQHVTVARRDQHMAAQHRIAVLGFLDLDLAERVEAFGEGRRELLRHVLDDDDAGRIGRKLLQHKTPVHIGQGRAQQCGIAQQHHISAGSGLLFPVKHFAGKIIALAVSGGWNH